MSEPVASEHWLDRLAVRISRRTALKAGLAAAASISLPSVRPSPAAAAGEGYVSVEPCFYGCRSFEHQEFGRARAKCSNYNPLSVGGQGDVGFTLSLLALPLNIVSDFTQILIEDDLYSHCLDKAIAAAKIAALDCYGPNCSNFDPKQPNGPCDTCSQNCCVCPGIPNGYICCFYACGDPDHNCCGS
jgi:hypothetical protein